MSGQSKEARTVSYEIQKKDQWGEKNHLLNSGPRVELQRLFLLHQPITQFFRVEHLDFSLLIMYF